MKQLIFIGLFGGIGAVSRYLVSGWAIRWFGDGFPYGTLTVNLAGCFLLGALAHIGESTAAISPDTRQAVGIGFLGGLTTFSTFGFETFRCLENGTWWIAAANVLANVGVGLFAVWVGLTVARLVFGGA